MKKTEEEGSSFEEAFAALKNTRNKSGYSPNQLFLLHNPFLPSLEPELFIEEMVRPATG